MYQQYNPNFTSNQLSDPYDSRQFGIGPVGAGLLGLGLGYLGGELLDNQFGPGYYPGYGGYGYPHGYYGYGPRPRPRPGYGYPGFFGPYPF